MHDEICRRRLAGQFLTTAGPQRGADVVRALGAMQAQDYGGAKWAVAQRTTGRTDDEIEAELETGQILRTHLLRPTWHFVAPSDIRWMLALTGPRVSAMMAPVNRRLELDDRVYRRAYRVFTRALAHGNSLTRSELAGALARGGIAGASGQRLGHLMMQAELDGVVVSGPRRGKQFTYALLDERAPATPALPRDEALAELTRRYYTTRGPATPHDFSWWSGLTVSDARRGIALLGSSLERLTFGETDHWIAADSPAPPRRALSARLLPNYDEYFIGFRNRSAIGQRVRATSTVTGGSALIPHVIVVNGELVGVWRRALEKDRVVVTLEAHTELTRREVDRVAAEARRFGEFVGRPVEVRIP
ncbi:MAG TPA: winged helix DNA-binding domain-containing protein [Gemmatimonadaceae bacterium]|nr:winged helix DNA-binding domain-containing protein [Gemmatimonadaceae bacterium]